MRLPMARRFLQVALSLLTIGSPLLHSADYCVGTVTALNTALITSVFAGGAHIMLQQGTYHVGGSYLMGEHIEVGPVSIEGGYNSDCSARTRDPDNTIVDGDSIYAFQVMVVHGDASIDAVRFQHFNTFGGALTIQHQDTDGQNTTISTSEFLSMGFAEYRIGAGSATTRVIDTLVVNAPGEGLSLAYQDYGNSPYEPVDSVVTVLTNDTVVGSGDYGVLVESAGATTIANTIAWNNVHRDIFLERGDSGTTAMPAIFLSDTYATLYGSEAAGSSGTLHSDPQFVASNDFHLQNTSPAINSGSLLVPGGLPYTDIQGNPRVVGSAPDRGAYESSLDDTLPFILTVTNTADTGAGSLRQAILDANANPDVNIITFDIGGACPQTITIGSDLPSVSAGVLINGFTQSGSTANTSTFADNAHRCIIIDGGGVATTGLFYIGPASSQFWLQGVAMEGFTGAAVSIIGGTGPLIFGSQFGGVASGVALSSNGINVQLGGLVTGASIGGSDPSLRNVIGGATSYGIQIPSNQFANATGNTISNNLIGIAPNGLGENANGIGIYIATTGNTVQQNVISGNATDGILLAGSGATGNLITNNRIGLKSGFILCGIPPFPACGPGDLGLPNGRHGVRVEGGANHDRVLSNTIAYNASMGISLASGLGNKLLFNSIHDNAGYGVDLEGSGLNDNDGAAAAQNLPNRGLNFPVITRAYGGRHHGW
ncbi:MAG: right-handed parallel beta-helix repeat-containing protein, partial [Dokdonella sp.]